MFRPEISVIVPVYKVEQWLDRCVQSVLGQTFRNFEVLLIDDGSPDGCGDMCDSWARLDERIVAYHKPNGGLSDARNFGIDHARAPLVTFLDSDDALCPDCLQSLYELIKATPDVGYSECAYAMESNGRVFPSDESGVRLNLPAVDAFEHVLYHNHLSYSACAKLFRRELFKDVQFPVGRVYEEMYTIGEWITRSQRVAYVGRPLYRYILREDSITVNRKFGRANVRQMLEAAEHTCELAVSLAPSLAKPAQRFRSYAWMRTLRFIVDAGAEMDLSDITSEIRRHVLLNFWPVFLNRRLPLRDRIGMVSLIPGFWFFSRTWKTYLRFRRIGKSFANSTHK